MCKMSYFIRFKYFFCNEDKEILKIMKLLIMSIVDLMKFTFARILPIVSEFLLKHRRVSYLLLSDSE